VLKYWTWPGPMPKEKYLLPMYVLIPVTGSTGQDGAPGQETGPVKPGLDGGAVMAL
jgi:hypothetical protein